MKDLQLSMRAVIATERKALEALEQCEWDESALRALSECKGRIVFLGVGKSGHVGKKLAATFASLGVRSIFVHATEAMHGDLGMLAAEDVAVLLSNSGSTKEVTQCVAPIRALGVTTLALSSKADSPLATACDHKLIYPALAEADGLGLAPTTSSTLMLALGDALACALSKAKGFTRADFHAFHPNGALGEMLAKEQNNG